MLRATGIEREVDPRRFLTERQTRKMSTRPYMILQFAHHLAAKHGGPDRVEVFARSYASLNGRPYRVLVDPGVDLAAEPRRFLTAYPWIRPLDPGLERFESRQDRPPPNTVTIW